LRLSEGSLAEGLQLFALFGLAVAAPLFDLVRRSPGFLVAHGLAGAGLAALVAALLLALPLAAWLVLRALGRLAPRAAHALLAALAGALAAAFALPVLRALPVAAAAVPLALAALAGGSVALAFARRPSVRAFTALLAPLALFAPARLFADARITRLLAAPSTPAPAATAPARDLPSVVLVVFDELPTSSLLGADGRIDPLLYPSFADLAAHSTWFPRAGASGASTLEAVPAILTGRRPDPSRLATWADWPESLFALLAPTHHMQVHEAQTILYRGPRASGADRARAAGVAADLGVLWLHALLPRSLAVRLPDVEHGWRDFAWPDAGDLSSLAESSTRGRAEEFESFVASLDACPQPCLHFLHALLPHVPWLYTPSGRRYQPIAIPGLRREYWSPEPWWAVEGQQRHLLQLAYADRLLGALLRALRASGRFEGSLVIATADHGASFWPDGSRRDPDVARHPEDVVRVPLFVKLPGQTEGAVDARAAETIDLLPTLAAALGLELPWPVDGCSLLDPGCAERAEQVITDNGGNHYTFPAASLDGRASLERKLALFGTRPGLAGLYRVGPWRGWIGSRVEALAAGPPAPEPIEVDTGSFRRTLASPQAWAASRIVGRLATGDPGTRPTVAIAARGVLQAFAPALPGRDGSLVFSAEIPEEAFGGDPAELALFVVGGTPEAPVLHPVELRIGSVDLRGVGQAFAPPARGAAR